MLLNNEARNTKHDSMSLNKVSFGFSVEPDDLSYKFVHRKLNSGACSVSSAHPHILWPMVSCEVLIDLEVLMLHGASLGGQAFDIMS